MFDGKYFDWNQKKIKSILDFYGHSFMTGKKILDLGCGFGDISGTFYRLGADVTATDARQEHLKIVSKRYPGVKTVKADLDKEFPFYKQSFDLILNLSLLCHLSNYEVSLRAACASTKYMVLETAVCDSEDNAKNITLLDSSHNYDASFNGRGCIPSAATIERILQECGMVFQRLDNSKMNSGSFQYDWQSKNDNSYDLNKRRIWFCMKSSENNLEIKNGAINNLLAPQQQIRSPRIQNSNITINHAVLNSYKQINKNETQLESSVNLQTESSLEKNLNTNSLKDLKIALCISGHMRTFETTFPSIQNYILSNLDCDVFIHTWDTLGLSYRHLDVNLKPISSEELKNKINNLFKPKKLIIEPRREFRVSSIMKMKLEPGRDVHGMLSMFYKIEACNYLKKDYESENNMKYDLVIRFRPDLSMSAVLPITKDFDKNYLYLPRYGHFSGLCDQIAFGSSEVMDKYSCIFSRLQDLLEKGTSFNPEKVLQAHILSMGLPVSKVDVKYLIKRSNGLVQDNMILERALGFIK